MFIDIHSHAYRKDCPSADGNTRFVDPESLIGIHDKFGIEKAIILPLIGPEVYLPQSNEDILDICAAYPDRFIPFCNIDPRGMTNSSDAPLDIWLRHYKERGCKGIGEVMSNLPFNDPRCQNLFKHIEDIGLPMIIDMSDRIGGDYGLYDEANLPQLEATLQKFPNLKVLGHSNPFWCEISKLENPTADRVSYPYPRYPVTEEGTLPKLFRRYPNLYGDLSAGSGYNALARDPEYAVQFLNEFQDKLLFGTDICAPVEEIKLVKFLLEIKDSGKISEKVFNKISRENTIKLLNL